MAQLFCQDYEADGIDSIVPTVLKWKLFKLFRDEDRWKDWLGFLFPLFPSINFKNSCYAISTIHFVFEDIKNRDGECQNSIKYQMCLFIWNAFSKADWWLDHIGSPRIALKWFRDEKYDSIIGFNYTSNFCTRQHIYLTK